MNKLYIFDRDRDWADPEAATTYSTDITLRDLFAGFALAGLVSDVELRREDLVKAVSAGVVQCTAQLSYSYADAMLKERAK